MDNPIRVVSAMLKAGLERKAKLDPVTHARRVALESETQARRYCEAFALWRRCRSKICRWRRACNGDIHACLNRALACVPQPIQVEARQTILAATPHIRRARTRSAPAHATRFIRQMSIMCEIGRRDRGLRGSLVIIAPGAS